MCCERHHHGPHDYRGGCCCDVGAGVTPPFPFRRCFPTREERLAWLEEYLKELRAEASAVEQHIAELKAAG
jgi:hypothetical protein